MDRQPDDTSKSHVEHREDVQEAGKKPLWAEVRAHRRLLGFCVGVSFSALLFGFDSSIVSAIAAMPQFQASFGESHDEIMIIPALWLGLWNGFYPVGCMIGAAMGGFLQDRWGRRTTLALGSFLSAISVALCMISDMSGDIEGRRGLFLFSKTFQGISVGQLLITAVTYISENLPSFLRGPVFAIHPVLILLGQLVGAVVVQALLRVHGKLAYRLCFTTQWPFSVVLLTLCFFLPESPPWLIRLNRHDQALTAFRKLGVAGHGDVEAEFQSLQEVLAMEQRRAESESPVKYSECFRGVDRRRTFIAILAGQMPVAFGMHFLGSASYFFPILGIPIPTTMTFVTIAAALGILANLASFCTLPRFGRRILMLCALSACSLVWLAIGIAGVFPGPAATWFTAGGMMLVVIVNGIGVWPASLVVNAEVSSLRLRARTQGISGIATNLSSGVVSIALPYLYNPDQGDLGGKTGFFQAGLCILALVGTWLLVPEMKDRSMSEIDDMFELELPTREFKRWVSSPDGEHD